MKGWLSVLVFVVPCFLVMGVFQFFGFLAIGIDPANTNPSMTTWQHLVVSFLGFVGVVCALWLFMKFVDRKPFVSIGLQSKVWGKDILVGLTIGAGVMGFGFALLLLISEIEITGITISFSEILFTFLLFVVIAFLEEMLFRGYILRNFMLSFNRYIALLLSALFFGLVHGANPNMNWIGFFNLFLAGILLGVPYLFTKNLWLPISMHFSWNFFQSLLGFRVSGKKIYSIISFSTLEDNYLNGGKFGFEGSVLSLIIECVLVFGLWWYYSKKYQNSTIALNSKG